ncbi:MAG: (d)CMP kinase, partial [Actinobacteria bacterium]|nr:(d)CMP kinase [Actinomycetota bacterium]
GSVVCPDAALKIYLTARLDERIKRRDLQIRGKGQFLERNIIKKEIISRDRIDSSREDSPLIIPENGIIIDTSKLSVKGVVEKIKKLYFKKVNVKNET